MYTVNQQYISTSIKITSSAFMKYLSIGIFVFLYTITGCVTIDPLSHCTETKTETVLVPQSVCTAWGKYGNCISYMTMQKLVTRVVCVKSACNDGYIKNKKGMCAKAKKRVTKKSLAEIELEKFENEQQKLLEDVKNIDKSTAVGILISSGIKQYQKDNYKLSRKLLVRAKELRPDDDMVAVSIYLSGVYFHTDFPSKGIEILNSFPDSIKEWGDYNSNEKRWFIEKLEKIKLKIPVKFHPYWDKTITRLKSR